LPAESAQQVVQSVDLVYAEALLDLTGDAEQRDAIREEMDQIGQLLEDSQDLTTLLASRVLSTSERRQCLQRIFEGKISDLVYRFLQVVNNKDRLVDLPGIIRALGRLVDQQRGLIDVDAYLAKPMDQAQADRIAEGLGSVLAGTVVLHQHVDESLIGGIKLRVGDRLIDGSVATQLRLMKQRMIERGRAAARTAVAN
jgi:F-type H+-transporting ATPase subunit delta